MPEASHRGEQGDAELRSWLPDEIHQPDALLDSS